MHFKKLEREAAIYDVFGYLEQDQQSIRCAAPRLKVGIVHQPAGIVEIVFQRFHELVEFLVVN